MFDGVLALPIHPAFVHFPVAFFSATWGLTVLGHATGAVRWLGLAGTLEWMGLAFVPITIIAGIRDAEGLGFLVEPDFSQPLIWHFLLSIAASAAFAWHALWRRRRPTSGSGPTGAGRDLVFTTVGFWLLVMTGLVAGEMVFG